MSSRRRRFLSSACHLPLRRVGQSMTPDARLAFAGHSQGVQGPNEHGFLGFAVNLIYLPPHLMELRVPTSRGSVR